MKRPFKLEQSIVIKEERAFDDFIQKEQCDGFLIKILGNGKVRFVNKISIGVGSINNVFFESISMYGYKKKEGLETLFVLKNKLRIDIVVLFLITIIGFLGITYLQIFKGEPIPIWINLILFPISILFFSWIMYSQEKNLMQRVIANVNHLWA